MGRIVVGVDDSAGARAALAWAAREARLHQATLQVAHVFSPHELDAPFVFPSQYAASPVTPSGVAGEPWQVDVAGAVDIRARLRDAAAARAEELLSRVLDEMGEAVRELDVQRSVVPDRQPAAALVELSAGADLLVVGSRGRGGFGALLLGSVSHASVLHAACPVTVVPTRA
jgi:nucleotide-binding universal stress UspA family protein